MEPKSLDEIQTQWSAYARPEPGATYLHYKGGAYTVVATGFLEENTLPCVVYESQEDGTIWVRTAENFFEGIEYNGQRQPRFKKVGTDAEQENRT